MKQIFRCNFLVFQYFQMGEEILLQYDGEIE